MNNLFESPLGFPLAGTVFASGAAMMYKRGVDFRNHFFDCNPNRIIKTPRPVISVGGIRAGGSGKTPATMLLIECFTRFGYDIAVLSRGYKRKKRQPLLVDPNDSVTWEQIGDEPAMMRNAFSKIWLGIGADRSSSAIGLQHRMRSNSLYILDDGFQHRKLHRDLDIVCIHDSVFSDRLLPQGYLREPLDSLSRAHILFLIASDRNVTLMNEIGRKLSRQFPSADQFLLINKIEGWVNAESGVLVSELPISKPVAFCGIARPHRFFELLHQQGIHYCKKKIFHDHYNYRESDFFSFRKLYSQGFVTTEKDCIRIVSKKILPLKQLWYLKIRLHFAENDSLNRFNHYIKGISNKYSI